MWAANWASNDARAASVRATTSSPELPASRRWTIPGRSAVSPLPSAGDVREAGEQAVDEGAVGIAGAGMDDEPGRLVDDDDVGVGVDDAELDGRVGHAAASRTGIAAVSIVTWAPAARRVLPATTTSPSTRTAPPAISAADTARLTSARRATTRSSRSPSRAAGTVSEIMASAAR